MGFNLNCQECLVASERDGRPSACPKHDHPATCPGIRRFSRLGFSSRQVRRLLRVRTRARRGGMLGTGKYLDDTYAGPTTVGDLLR